MAGIVSALKRHIPVIAVQAGIWKPLYTPYSVMWYGVYILSTTKKVGSCTRTEIFIIYIESLPRPDPFAGRPGNFIIPLDFYTGLEKHIR
jgi:hypothetical protein